MAMIVGIALRLATLMLSSFDHPSQRQPERQFRPFLLLFAGLNRIAPSLKPHVQKTLIKIVYQIISAGSKDSPNVFMNYGYVPLDHPNSLLLSDVDENNRYSIQLYHHVAAAVDLRGKDVLEVGSGRGGGAAWMTRYFEPRSMTGVDFASQAIAFCQRRYQIKGLSFRRGDAEDLPFPPNTFDVVVNVESSHCYPSADRFFREVRRVLRPQGYFLLADLRPEKDVALLRDQLRRSGLTILEEECITANVVRSLELDTPHRRAVMQHPISRLFPRASREFLGAAGSQLHAQLRNGEMQYLRFVLRKDKGATGMR
jgi:SAM-dependent methyltransferase